MATAPANNSTRRSTVAFHKKTYGSNIRLENDAFTATRHTSFDNGITFSERPIKIDERIYMKVIDVDDSRQWLGSLAIGFTHLDPNTISRDELCKSALPNLSKKTGTSYLRRIVENLTRDVIITFYFNQNGAFYILDGKENRWCDIPEYNRSLWAVVDIYGNVKSISLTTEPNTTASSSAFFSKYAQKPDQLPIRYYTNLTGNNLQPVQFFSRHGPELDLFCQNKVVLRKNVQQLIRPYVFIDLPMTPGDELFLRILSIDPNYRTSGIIGFTTAEPSVFIDEFDRLPSQDPAALVDRLEFWILKEDPFDPTLTELDEYRIVFAQNGEISLHRNNPTNGRGKTLVFADAGLKFYPFFFLNGRVNAFSLFGLISPVNKSSKINSPTATNDDEKDDEGLCQICLSNQANCVLLPCGHIFFCMTCKTRYEQNGRKQCPNCRQNYTDIVEIQND